MPHILKDFTFFSNFSEQELGKIFPLVKEEFFPENKGVFQKGDYGNKMYFILNGEIKIYDVKIGLTRKIMQAFSLNKDEKEIGILRKGDFFGEMALVSDSPRLFSAKAVANTTLYSLNKADLQNLLKSNEEAEKLIAETLIKRIMLNTDTDQAE